MNGHVLIAVIASIIYIPLFVILLINRPWDRQQKIFFLFLVPAFLWSFTAIFFRSDFLMEYKLLLVRIGLCASIGMGIQYHYFLRSFYDNRSIKRPMSYILLAIAITMVSLGYIPQRMEVTAGSIQINYGAGFFIVLFPTIFLCGRDVYLLLRRHGILVDPTERNQIVYLFLGLSALFLFGMVSITPFGSRYPLVQLGTFFNAAILTYAVVVHKLLDFREVFRRTLTSAIYGALFILVCLLWLLLFQKTIHMEVTFFATIVALSCTWVMFIFFGVKARSVVSRKTEVLFRSNLIKPRHQLYDFVSEIYDVPTLGQFGNQLIYLLSQSIDCERACLLFPQAENGDFTARFVYPSGEENPIAKLKLRNDSPTLVWLKREVKVLPVRTLSILTEFQGLWQEEKNDIKSAGVNIFIPLVNRNEVVAALAVGNKRGGKVYTVEDMDLAESVANRVAASMEKEYLHEQVKEQGEELAIINRLISLVTSNLNIQDIFKGFSEELKKVMDVDWATIVLVEGDQLNILALSGNIDSPWEQGNKVPLKGTVIEWVINEHKPIYEADIKRHRKYWVEEHLRVHGICSIVYLPLIAQNKSIGILAVASRRLNAYSPKQIKLLEQLALQIATPIENLRLYATSEQRARVDELTKLFNRRHFDEQFKAEISRHGRNNQILSLLMLDLDSFKTYNDIFGHPSGDKLLGEIGKIINSSIRNGDQAFRYGGDEFVVLLPQTREKDAFIVAERIRENVMNRMVTEDTTVRLSIGLASYPVDGLLTDEIVTVADTALYYAKSTGGNRTCLSSNIISSETAVSGGNARVSSLSTVYALASAVDAKDHYTYGHSRKVRVYAVTLAEAIGLPADAVSRISTAAVLHDIGKIGIPDKILNKEDGLDREEWDAIKTHPRIGANIAGNVPSLAPCRNGILYHHERWDGTGYPEGLKGDNIPIDARILAIADAFAAMTSSRPYRGTMLDEEAIKELEKEKNKQFDPKLIDIFVNIVKNAIPEKSEVADEHANNIVKIQREDGTV
jgi:diguanylate cyclase (GGDEF)-like protein